VPRKRFAFLIVAILAAAIDSDRLTIALTAQEPEPVAFEIASIKPNLSGDVSFSIYPLAGRTFSAENAPLRDLIRYAYQISDFELEDAPADADIRPVSIGSGSASRRRPNWV
jgi:hypothetical protein